MKTSQHGFSIRITMLLILSVSLIGLLVAVYFILHATLEKSYTRIEQDEVIQNLTRADDAVTETVSQLNIKLTDWARWDDTYAFIHDGDAAYINSNLGIGSISNLKINTMVFVDPNGKIVFSRTVDYRNKNDLPGDTITAEVAMHPRLHTFTSMDASATGIVSLPEGPMFVVSQPILTSDGEGPIRGALVFGKYFDDTELHRLSELTHLAIKVYPYADASLPAEVAVAKKLLGAATPYVVTPVSDDTVSGFSVLSDLYGAPTLILRVDMPRTIHSQGKQTLVLFMLIASGAAFLLGICILLMLDRFIIARLVALSNEVERVRTAKDPTLRVGERGRDEIGSLSRAINAMIDRISSSEIAEHEAKEKAQRALAEQQSSLDELEKTNKLMVDREIKMVELKKELVDLREESGEERSQSFG